MISLRQLVLIGVTGPTYKPSWLGYPMPHRRYVNQHMNKIDRWFLPGCLFLYIHWAFEKAKLPIRSTSSYNRQFPTIIFFASHLCITLSTSAVS